MAPYRSDSKVKRIEKGASVQKVASLRLNGKSLRGLIPGTTALRMAAAFLAVMVTPTMAQNGKLAIHNYSNVPHRKQPDTRLSSLTLKQMGKGAEGQSTDPNQWLGLAYPLLRDLPRYQWGAALASDSRLDGLHRDRLLVPLGRQQPFKNVSAELKREDSNEKDKTVWVGLGWVAWSEVGSVRALGDCARYGWDGAVCVEQPASDYYVIKQLAGHPGWPVHGIGVAAQLGSDAAERAGALMDWAASKDASEVLRDFFVVVPHDDVRLRRTVIFELYAADRKQLIATTDASTRHPLPAKPSTSDKTNACGGVGSACPPYKVPADKQGMLAQEAAKAKQLR